MRYKGINVEKINEIQRVKLPNADAFKKFSPEDIENICSNTDSFDAVCNQIKKELEARKNDTEMAIICEMALNYLQSMKDKETADTEAYNKGLNDGRNEVWEWIKKICTMPSEGKIKMFGGNYSALTIVGNYTPQEALAKLEAYEKEQNEIKVGDVVIPEKGVEFIVTYISSDSHLFGITATGDTYTALPMKYCKKTGRHIDIQPILEQIEE